MNNFFKPKFINNYLLISIILLIVFRIISLFLSPLEISADEAQYWLWSQNFEFGYFSKPPMIAWIISIGNFLFGESVPSIRIFAPIINFLNAFILYLLFKEIFPDQHYNFLIVPLIWLTLPITGIGSFLISTDTPLIFFWSISLLFILYGINSNFFIFWLLAGLFSGLAVLSKYAGLFLLLGVILLYFFNKSKNLKSINVFFYFCGILISSSPNIIWNINNNFTTIFHLSDNAVLNAPKYSLEGSIEFIISQIAVIGPVMFLIFIFALITSRKNIKINWLIWFTIPVFLTMTIQGFFSEANANWAATALPGLTIYCAYYLKNRTFLSFLAISVNLCISLMLVLISILGNYGDFGPKSDPLRKLKGWEELSQNIITVSEENKIDYVVVSRRGIAAPLIYYLRNNKINIRLLPLGGTPKNHYQFKYPLNLNETKKIIFISENHFIPNIWGENQVIKKLRNFSFDISNNIKRDINFYLIRLAD